MSINQNDLGLGKRALQRGFLTTTQLQNAIVENCKRQGQSGASGGSLGFFLLSKGYLTPEQLAELMRSEPASPVAAPKPPAAQPPPPPPVAFAEAKNRVWFGKYKILRELGRGSMGEVLEAVDTSNGRRVALKRPFIKRQSGAVGPKDEERFLVEANIVSLLPRHPNVIEVYESGKIDGQCYIAMEVIEGQTMIEWRKHATFRQEINVILQVAEGVHHAHEYGVVHRDLKPHNVMMCADGRAVVADFGLAKSTQWAGSVSLTPVGWMVGSPGYMSPEQAACIRNVDRRTDVYSLGVMLYQALTGRKPFEGRTAMEILLRMEQDPVRRPSEIMRAGLNPVLYQDLETVCMRALQKNPRDRYPNARRFSDELAQAVDNTQKPATRSYLAG
jgi:eukaryotic-like serine/threonine-protein kinase